MIEQPLALLHVEDDSDIREITKLALELGGGFELCQCETARSALTLAATRSFDAFLLDVMMPGMTGLELLRELRKIPDCKSVPAIFLTARTGTEGQSKYHSAGAAGLIEKPFDPLQLAAQVKGILKSIQ